MRSKEHVSGAFVSLSMMIVVLASACVVDDSHPRNSAADGNKARVPSRRCLAALLAATALRDLTKNVPDRSVCRWTYRTDHSLDRIPSEYPVAVCEASSDFARQPPGKVVRCEPVYYYVAARYKRSTGDAVRPYVWVDGWEKLTVGCATIMVDATPTPITTTPITTTPITTTPINSTPITTTPVTTSPIPNTSVTTVPRVTTNRNTAASSASTTITAATKSAATANITSSTIFKNTTTATVTTTKAESDNYSASTTSTDSTVTIATPITEKYSPNEKRVVMPNHERGAKQMGPAAPTEATTTITKSATTANISSSTNTVERRTSEMGPAASTEATTTITTSSTTANTASSTNTAASTNTTATRLIPIMTRKYRANKKRVITPTRDKQVGATTKPTLTNVSKCATTASTVAVTNIAASANTTATFTTKKYRPTRKRVITSTRIRPTKGGTKHRVISASTEGNFTTITKSATTTTPVANTITTRKQQRSRKTLVTTSTESAQRGEKQRVRWKQMEKTSGRNNKKKETASGETRKPRRLTRRPGHSRSTPLPRQKVSQTSADQFGISRPM